MPYRCLLVILLNFAVLLSTARGEAKAPEAVAGDDGACGLLPIEHLSWTMVLQPSHFGTYINDHTIFQDGKGAFRMLGISSMQNNGKGEVAFLEAVAPSFLGPYGETRLLLRDEPFKGLKLAPHVVFHQGQYHLFFGPRIIHHMVSADGHSWKEVAPAVKSKFPGLRDPMVFRDGELWYLYATDFGNRVSSWTSPDLYHWNNKTTALSIGAGLPASINSSAESPFVFKIGDTYYLSITLIEYQLAKKQHLAHYNNTILVASDQPNHFGRFSCKADNTASLLRRIYTHAPEYFQADGKIYVTSAGWRGRPRPEGVSDGSLAVANLPW